MIEVYQLRANSCRRRLALFSILQKDQTDSYVDFDDFVDSLTVAQIISLDTWSKYSAASIDTNSLYYQKLKECHERFGQECFSPKVVHAISDLLKKKGIAQKSEAEVQHDLHRFFDTK